MVVVGLGAGVNLYVGRLVVVAKSVGLSVVGLGAGVGNAVGVVDAKSVGLSDIHDSYSLFGA